MSAWTSTYVLVLGALVLLWLGVSAYVLVTRALFDFRHLAFHGARRIVGYWLGHADTDEEKDRLLRKLPRRTLAGIASDAHVEPTTARLAASILLERRWAKLLRRAEGHRNEADKWRRIATLRIFAIAGWHIALPLLREALEDEDDDVAAAAVSILGDLADARATEILLAGLVENHHQRSRIATQLDGHVEPAQLLGIVDHPDPEVRTWVATLLRPHRLVPEAELALAVLAHDPSPDVRAAVARTYAGARDPQAGRIVAELLRDRTWFVRAQAARTLASAGGAELAHALVPLLRDEHWWVRDAAKETLAAYGAGAVGSLLPLLHDDDEFARNGAAEVLTAGDALARWVEAAADEGDDGALTSVLADALQAGGERVQQVALEVASPRARATVERLLTARAR